MQIRCRCSKCESKFKADEVSAGLKIACPRCGGVVMVPPMAQAIEDPTTTAIPRVASHTPPISAGPPDEIAPPGNPWPLRVGLAALGLVAIAAALFVVYLVNRPAPPTAIELRWPLADRKDAFLEISGNSIDLVKRDPLLVHVAPGPHRVTIRRKGFEPVIWNFTLIKGEQKHLTPEWQAVP